MRSVCLLVSVGVTAGLVALSGFCARLRPVGDAGSDEAVAQSHGGHALDAQPHGTDANSAGDRGSAMPQPPMPNPMPPGRGLAQSHGADTAGLSEKRSRCGPILAICPTRRALKTPITCARPATRRRPSPSSG
jgi:hypothetical protein